MVTNQIEYKDDGVYYNNEFVSDDGNSVRLNNQTINTGVATGDVVDFDINNDEWVTIDNKYKAKGVYEGNNTVVLFGKCELSGLTPGKQYAQDSGQLSTNINDVKIGQTISSAILLVDIDIEGIGGSYQGSSVTKLYGGLDVEAYYPSCFVGEYFYASGITYSDGQGSRDCLVVKYDKNLNIINKKIYGGTNMETATPITDGESIYLCGATDSEGQGDYDSLILKYDQNLNILAKKLYGGGSGDYFRGGCFSNGFLYICGDVGAVSGQGLGAAEALIAKYDTDLNFISAKIYTGTGFEHYFGICSDGKYLYVVGDTDSSGSGLRDCLIAKYDKNLNLISAKTLGGSNDEAFYRIIYNNSYIYAVGYTASTGAGGSDAMIVKYDTDLNLISAKTYGGTGSESFNDLVYYDSCLYLVGYTASAGAGGNDAMIVKYDTDLNLISAKTYGGTENSTFSSVVTKNGFLYISGNTASQGQGNSDALISKMDINIPSGSLDSIPTGFVFQDLSLTDQVASLTEQAISLTHTDSSLVAQDSNLTEGVPNLTESGPYITY